MNVIFRTLYFIRISENNHNFRFKKSLKSPLTSCDVSMKNIWQHPRLLAQMLIFAAY